MRTFLSINYAVRDTDTEIYQYLGDGILIKDNHIAALRQTGMSLTDIITNTKQKASNTMKIEIEVNTFADAMEAITAGADIIMLDNIVSDEMRRIVNATPGRVKFEASGNINLDNIRDVAITGVDFISVGAITHSARVLDFSLEIKSAYRDTQYIW